MLMIRCVPLFCLGLFFFLGCKSDSKTGPVKVKVSGTVHMDNKPMPLGAIRFTQGGIPPAELEIKEGSYSGEVPEGKNKVEIVRYKEDKSTDPPAKVNDLPAKWNTESKFTVEITSSTTEIPTFKITSK